jgi:hypothetical protein
MTPALEDDDPAEQGKYGERDSPWNGTDERQAKPEHQQEVEDPPRGEER